MEKRDLDLAQMVSDHALRVMDKKGIFPCPGFGLDAEGKLS